ncbi:DUF4269 domain-containing protein [Oceanithermus sp.]|uniref:DUF4269 domain-containing protein n=1 Tax=Oceanithermus sp. TaxID=2268145 RepID=UPI00257C2E50|nr:DUF4269 domain-containing protein [Oceanithermus sp.]
MTARRAAALAAFARLARHPALRGTDPRLAGTFPLGLDVAGSDLDVVGRTANPERFARRLARAFGGRPGFRIRLRHLDGRPTVVARFREGGFPVEVFAQARPPGRQRAVRHLRVEARLLRVHGEPLRTCVRRLRRSGLKTEPAFARCLGVAGDPYAALLELERRTNAELARLSGKSGGERRPAAL